jgi:hypothetical protein
MVIIFGTSSQIFGPNRLADDDSGVLKDTILAGNGYGCRGNLWVFEPTYPLLE